MNKLDWLKERQKGIGGSDVGAILGINKWKTPFQIYIEKTEEITEVQEQSEAAYWGDMFEDVVAKEFSKITGKKVRRDKRHFKHKDYPFMVANIDRKIVGENAILECKTANQYLAKEWDGDEIPASYLCQVQHYLAVTGAEKGYIAVLVGGQKFIWKEIDRDEELINMIIKAEINFWKLVENKTPPELDGSSAAEKWVNEKFKKSNQELATQFNSNYTEKLKTYFELKEYEKQVTEEIKAIENQIKLELGHSEFGYGKGFSVTWKPTRRKSLDSKRLKSEQPDIYEKYIKESISRRFIIKEEK